MRRELDPSDATRPSAEEIDRLVDPLEGAVLRAAAEVTAPTDAEVRRLLALAPRRALAAPPRHGLAWSGAVWGGLALAAGLGLAILFSGPRYGDPSVVAGEVAALSGDLSLATAPEGALVFGPSIRAWGDGDLAALQADRGGTVLELRSGAATFEVDPDGPLSALTVRADDVEIEVTGTRFSVALDGAAVAVAVARGSVAIRAPGDARTLKAGERWRSAPEAPTEGAGADAPPAERPSGEAPREDEGLAGADAPPGEATAPSAPPGPDRAVPSPPSEAPPQEDAPSAARDWAEVLDARDAEAGDLLARLEAFLEVHGASPFAQEARVLQMESMAAAGDPRALETVEAWLATWPDAPRQFEVHYLRATLLREGEGGCRLALPSYRVASAGGRGALRESAEAWVERCEAETSAP